MEAIGNLGRKILAYAVIAIIAIVALKLVIGALVGFAQAVVSIMLLFVIAFGAIWAFRHI